MQRLIDGAQGALLPEAGKVKDVAVQDALLGRDLAGAFAARRPARARADERPLRFPAPLPEIGEAVLAADQGIGERKQPAGAKGRQDLLLLRIRKAGDGEPGARMFKLMLVRLSVCL